MRRLSPGSDHSDEGQSTSSAYDLAYAVPQLRHVYSSSTRAPQRQASRGWLNKVPQIPSLSDSSRFLHAGSMQTHSPGRPRKKL